jgi:glucosamine--fructose-6-phosphate aminotransferase (isomerizing)
MCGIVGYIGDQFAGPILLNGLKRLEYRGYDSAGIALLDDQLRVYKCKGKVADLRKLINGYDGLPTLGIGHTRWATHGEPSNINAHPHISGSEELALVHNGIIENYLELKKKMQHKGITFSSQTDTEVLVKWIEFVMEEQKLPFLKAIPVALRQVEGSYAFTLISKSHPDILVAARKGSPLAIGLGNGNFYIASDMSPIVEHTKEIVYLEDGEIAVLSRNGKIRIETLDHEPKPINISKIELTVESLEKGNYPHYMLKEIFDQPALMRNTLRKRLDYQRGSPRLEGIEPFILKILTAQRVIFIACGTSWHACLVGAYMLEDIARVQADVQCASEFRYRNPLITNRDVIVAVSQSGETADTLAALNLAKANGASTLAICNVPGSSLTRIADETIYLNAGPEIGVASTKAFTAQLMMISLIVMASSELKATLPENSIPDLLRDLNNIPNKMMNILALDDKIKNIAEKYASAQSMLFLGRGYAYPVALEGALKLKEISYVHAEGFPAAELKHGPIALIDEKMPVVAIATKGKLYEKTISNVEEVRARKGKIISIVTRGDSRLPHLSDDIIEIPPAYDSLMPLLSIIPLQLFAYHMAIARGCDVDQPRNLAKSVTVE